MSIVTINEMSSSFSFFLYTMTLFDFSSCIYIYLIEFYENEVSKKTFESLETKFISKREFSLSSTDAKTQRYGFQPARNEKKHVNTLICKLPDVPTFLFFLAWNEKRR